MANWVDFTLAGTDGVTVRINDAEVVAIHQRHSGSVTTVIYTTGGHIFEVLESPVDQDGAPGNL